MSQIAAQATTDELRTRKLELVLQQLESLPTLPAIAVRLLNLTGSSESRIQEVVELISADPVLTSKLLSLVGSAAVGLRQPVTTVRQAVVMLGFETLRNLVLSVKVFEAFAQEGQTEEDGEAKGGEGFNRADFWKHSLAVATAAEALAPRCRPALSAHDAFVCGLLHDLGKVAFDAVMPKSFGRVVEVATLTRGDIADVERRVIGLDHGVAGKRLAEAWHLPDLIVQAIWLHGAAPMSVPTEISSARMVQLIGLADFVARRQHIGFSGNYLFPYELKQYLEPLGLSQADVTAVTEKLAEDLEKRAVTLGLSDSQSRQVYLQSIANANAELGRVNQILSTQNRKLAQRSECFDLLTRFYQRITPTATPGQMLSEVGQVAHRFFQSERLVLFSQAPDQPLGEVFLFHAKSSLQEGFMMQMPAFGGDQRAARGSLEFIRPARPQLDWILERVQTLLAHELEGGGGKHRWWFMPLTCGGQPVGGVLWPQWDAAAKGDGPQMTAAMNAAAMSDLPLVSEAWGVTLRSAQVRQQHNIVTEALAASNRELGTLQQQLVRAKSLAGLGEMAAGAAHEMNNPLAVVCGRAQLLASKLTDENLKQDASLIAQQGERLSQIITDMMAFAKPAAPRLMACTVGDLAREAIEAARARLTGGAENAGIPVKLEVAADLPPVHVDAAQIRSAITEVVLNGLQACTSETAKQKGVLVQVRYDALDGRVIIQVADSGVGMSEETTRQAFAPFYSAKTAGRQRGMGLPKALRWMELHGGTIRLDSRPALGTTVVMILPVGTEAVTVGGAGVHVGSMGTV